MAISVIVTFERAACLQLVKTAQPVPTAYGCIYYFLAYNTEFLTLFYENGFKSIYNDLVFLKSLYLGLKVVLRG